MPTLRPTLLTLLFATLWPHLALAQPAPDLAFDDLRLTVSIGPPTTIDSPSTPVLPRWSSKLTATRKSWVVEHGSRRVALGLDPDRFRPSAHLAGGDLWLREVSYMGDEYARQARLVRVSPTGKTSEHTFPSSEATSTDRVCAQRYWVAVMPLMGTVIFDLTDDRVVVHDREAGIHARATAYLGPTCSPDGRYVAVPGTFHRDVVILRLADGTRAARFEPGRSSPLRPPGTPPEVELIIEPGAVTWQSGQAALIIHPTWVTPPK